MTAEKLDRERNGKLKYVMTAEKTGLRQKWKTVVCYDCRNAGSGEEWKTAVCHARRKGGSEERQREAKWEDTKWFEIMAWKNICIKNDWQYTKQNYVDRHDDQCHNDMQIG